MCICRKNQVANIHWIIERAREFQKNICFIDYAKVFHCVDHNKLENSKTDENTRLLDQPPEKPVCRSRNNSQNHTWNNDWFTSGREYVSAEYCHLADLTYIQKTSCEMLGWMKPKLEIRLKGEITIISDMQMTPPLWQKGKRN